MAKFQPVVKRSRFSVPGFTIARMTDLGNAFIASRTQNILAGRDIYDAPAPPLAAGYAKWKKSAYGSGIRNWKWSGRLLRTMKILTVSPTKVTIGFPDPVIANRVTMLQRLGRMWGISPSDKAAVAAKIDSVKSEAIKAA